VLIRLPLRLLPLAYLRRCRALEALMGLKEEWAPASRFNLEGLFKLLGVRSDCN
jgi:hypothetical protein